MLFSRHDNAPHWRNLDLEGKIIILKNGIWHQHLGEVETPLSESQLPLDEEMIEDLIRWRRMTPYAGDDDWIFASPRMQGRQPYWPDALMKHIRNAAKEAGIRKHISWHVFRHTFATLLHENGEDIKTVQRLLRHPTPKLTLENYIHLVQARERFAQSKIVRRISPTVTVRTASIQ